MLPEPQTAPLECLPEEVEAEEDVFKTKKKKKKLPKAEAVPARNDDYSYMDLLDKIYARLPKKIEMRNKLPAPSLYKVGTKRTRINNFRDICAAMDRPADHVAMFISIELETLASIGENGTLNIKGVLRDDQIVSLIKKYLKDYVVCGQCQSWHTIIEHSDRLMFLVCKEECASRFTLAPMRKGYQAKTSFQKKVLT